MAEFWHPVPKYGPEFQQLGGCDAHGSLRRADLWQPLRAGRNAYLRSTGRPVRRPRKYRKTLHEAWARGLNQAVIHKYTHQPIEEKPGMHGL